MNSRQTACIEPLESRRLMAGDLVMSFGGGDGSAPLTQNPSHAFTQNDGRIIVARIGAGGGLSDLRRFLPDGAADDSFDAATLRQALTARIGTVANVTMDDAGRLIFASGTAVTRVTQGGRIDRTFGKRGVVHIGFAPRSIAVLDNGSIVATGRVGSGDSELTVFTEQMTLLAPDGGIDTRFGNNGTINIGQTSFDRPGGVSTLYESDVVAEQFVSVPGAQFVYLREVHMGVGTEPSSIGGRLINPDGTFATSFNFDRTNVLTADDVDQFASGEAESRDGRLLDGARRLLDGSIEFLMSPDSTDPGSSQMANLALDGTISNVRDFADDFRSPLRDPQNGALYLPNSNGSSITRFTSDGVEEATFDVNLQDPGGAWVPLTFGSDGNLVASYHDADNNPIVLGKIHATDAPTGTFWGGPIRRERSSSYRFTVTWDDPDGIDVSTLASRAIVIDLPDGSTRTAVFESATPSTDSDTVVATYHFRAPGDGTWDSGDNGRYIVRLRGKHVADTTGQRAIGRKLGEFFVDIEVEHATIFGGARADLLIAPRAVHTILQEPDEVFI